MLFVTAWSMTLEDAAIKPIKDWVAKHGREKICEGTERIALLAAMKEVSPAAALPPVHTRSPPHPTITAAARADWILRHDDRCASGEDTAVPAREGSRENHKAKAARLQAQAQARRSEQHISIRDQCEKHREQPREQQASMPREGSRELCDERGADSKCASGRDRQLVRKKRCAPREAKRTMRVSH